MTKIQWDQDGSRYYELGVDRGVLYPQVAAQAGQATKYDKGVAWNGLTSVTESPDGAEANDMYADNIKYGSVRSAETFGGTIEAYTYPDEFGVCDGSAEIADGVYIGQQKRRSFGLSYRTKIENDASIEAYRLHVVYGCTASPSEKAYETVNDSPEGITFSWEFDTTPVAVEGYDATSIMIIDSRKVDAAKLAKIEAKLYGNETDEPTILMPNEILTILAEG